MKQKKLTNDELEKIRQEVLRHSNSIDIVTTTVQSDEPEITDNIEPNAHINDDNHANEDSRVREMEEMIKIRIMETQKYASMNERPMIKKITMNGYNKQQIKIANEVLGKLTHETMLNLTQINEMLYATAIVIAGEEKKCTQNLDGRNKEPKVENQIEEMH